MLFSDRITGIICFTCYCRLGTIHERFNSCHCNFRNLYRYEISAIYGVVGILSADAVNGKDAVIIHSAIKQVINLLNFFINLILSLLVRCFCSSRLLSMYPRAKTLHFCNCY